MDARATSNVFLLGTVFASLAALLLLRSWSNNSEQILVEQDPWSTTLTSFCSKTAELLRDTASLTADDQFQMALWINVCKDSKSSSDHVLVGEKANAAERILLYASALSYKPSALMALAQKHESEFYDAYGSWGEHYCFASSRYSGPAAIMLNEIDSRKPRALSLKVPPHSPPSNGLDIPESPLASHLKDISRGDATMGLPGGQRFLLGGDGFSQSYKTARNLFIQSIAEGSVDGLVFYSYMLFDGLGGEQDVLTATRLFFLAAKAFKTPLAILGLGNCLAYLVRNGAMGSYAEASLAESRRLFELAGTLQSDFTVAGFNLASLDLMSGGPLRAKVFMNLAKSIATSASSSSVLVARLIEMGSLGPRVCSQSASLYNRVSRKSLWAHAIASSMADNREAPQLLSSFKITPHSPLFSQDDGSLIKHKVNLYRVASLAYSGAEQGHWLFANLGGSSTKSPLKKGRVLEELVRSSEGGRRDAQIAIGHSVRKTGLPEIEHSSKPNSIIEKQEILNEWFRTTPREVLIKTHYPDDHISSANYMLGAFRSPRWLVDDEKKEKKSLVEASLMMAWMSLTRRHAQQGLREAMKWFARISLFASDMNVIQFLAVKTVQISYIVNLMEINSAHLLTLIPFICVTYASVRLLQRSRLNSTTTTDQGGSGYTTL